MELRVVLRRILERIELQPAAKDPDKVQFRAIALAPRDGVLVVQTQPPVRASARAQAAAAPV